MDNKNEGVNNSSLPLQKIQVPVDLNTRLKGKVAIVTASTEGIGFAIARRLAREGAAVLISSRRENNVKRAVEELKEEGLNVEGIVCHVGIKENRDDLFKTVVEKFGGLDILVSNAAVNPYVGPVLETEERMWDKIFDINVKSSYLLAKQSLPLIRKRGGGSILFISSIVGLQPIKIIGTYSVAKTALISLTKTASMDVGCDNIRINCIAPGVIPTKFSSAFSTEGDITDWLHGLVPLNRFGKPDEIAATAAFLVSDDASFITGETVAVSGGMPSRL